MGVAENKGSVPRLFSIDRLFEVLFLTAVGAAFGYLLIASRGWQAGAALVPTIIGVLGLPLLVAYIVQRVRAAKSDRPGAQILDIGFTDSELSASVMRNRAFRFFGWMALLIGGVWLVGFHITVPAYLVAYLILYGRVRWWVAVLTAVAFEAVLLGLYDEVLHSAWNEPVIQQMLGMGR